MCILCLLIYLLVCFYGRGCSNPVISTGHTSVDIGASANLEVVDKFCYLGGMLSVDGDADAAVECFLWYCLTRVVSDKGP